jgi:hypothetical protein
MYPTASLVTRFARNSSVIRSETPLSDDQMRCAAPSIFAEGKHASRSERYTHIPTIEVLRGLRKEGFEPFMVAQGASRIEGKAAYTKHMVRLRQAGVVNTKPAGTEFIHNNRCYGGSRPRNSQRFAPALGGVARPERRPAAFELEPSFRQL